MSWRSLLMITLALTLAGGIYGSSAAAKETDKPAPKELRAPTAQEIETAKKTGKIKLTMETDKGTILLELEGSAAPVSVANFLNLVNAGFYNQMPFHRVEPGFVIQAGDPMLVGRPTVSYTIPDERSPIKHTRGVIAMARLFDGRAMIPNSASTQFYLCLGEAPHLDKMGFAPFGRVIKGLEVIDNITRGDKIKQLKLAK